MSKTHLYIFLITGLMACKDSEVVDSEERANHTKFSYETLNLTIDSLQYNHPLQLDLNKDSQPDFILTSLLLEENDLPYLYLLINRSTGNSNKVLVKTNPELTIYGFWGMPLEKEYKIQESTVAGTQWTPDQSKCYLLNLMDNGINKIFGGEWIGKKDKYLGLKFKINGLYHYGWLRISHTLGEGKLIILDYTYNKVAGEAIAAGEK